MSKHIPSPELEKYLTSWLNKAKKYQESKGTKFELSLDDFYDLWGDKRLQKLEKYLVDGFGNVMTRKSQYAYVLSWAEGRRKPVMDKTTARVCSRGESKKACIMKKGEKHSEDAKKRIGQAKLGKKQTPEQIAKRTAARVATMKAKRESL